jgi:NAD(P)-dependent dehydrogenase (short-subunit alcohol dehydrogenase family)
VEGNGQPDAHERVWYVDVAAQRALVTDGASGIGAALVALLRQRGVAVEVLDLASGFDAGDPAGWQGVGPVDLAFLNAGMTTGEPSLVTLSDSTYRRVVSANLDGVVFGTRQMARVMRPGGAIVVTASLAGIVPLPDDPIYTLTKHAVVGFVRAAAPQLAQRGIRICALAPGIVDTPLIGATRDVFLRAGYPLLEPETVAVAALGAAEQARPGEVIVVQPGRDAVPMRFPNVPGARDRNGERAGPPPYPGLSAG